IFVTSLYPYSFVFIFPLFEYAITKLSVVAGFHFIDVGKDDIVTRDEVGHISRMVYSIVVAHDAVDKAAGINTAGQLKVSVVQIMRGDIPNLYNAIERGVLYLFGVKYIANPYVVPICRVVVIF